MKKFLNLISFLMIPSLLISCGEESVSVVEEIRKTKLNYTYSDVCNNYYKTSSAIPNEGSPKLLILPIYFSDSAQFIPEECKETVRKDIETAFFGTKEETGFESVTSYYSTLSCGKCTLEGTVSEWISVEESYTNFAIDETETMRFCTNVVDKYFAETGEDRTIYDLDKNGYLDGVVLIYGAPDYGSFRGEGSGYSNLWAYNNWIDVKANVDSPVTCNFMWASFDFMYGNTTSYSKIGRSYGGGDTRFCSLDTHIYIHETGHMFGLVDYYDYSYQFNPAGGFSMQDCNIGSHDPYSVMALGWCDPYIPTDSCTITINTFQSSRDCIILSSEWNEFNSPFDEYLVIEFYSPDGLNEFDHINSYNNTRPTGPNDCGIRLWHVDARLLYDNMRDATKTTCNPCIENTRVVHMMSNTYSSTSTKGYTTPLGSNYTKYNILQLIRNEETETYQPSNNFDEYSLFKNGNKFSMNTFKKQFPNGSRLNSNKILGWTFSVEIIDDQAKIDLRRTL